MNRQVLGTLILATTVATTHAIDGHAVSVSWREGCAWASNLFDEAPEIQEVTGIMRGALCKYTIVNNHTTQIDTLHYRSQGMAQYPALSFDGQNVAFYRWGSRVEGTSLLGTSDPCYISVVNIDGTGLTNLADLGAKPASECAIDWPAGDWIYYVKPKSGANVWDRESPHIWRVNLAGTVNEHVCTVNSSGSTPDNAWLRRFTLSADASRAGLQGINYGFNLNGAYNFITPDCNESGNNLGWAGSCNASISPSGCYVGGYMGGWHQEVNLDKLAGAWCTGLDPTTADFPTLQDVAAWTGEETGVGAEVIRWSVNSDKWLTQCIGWFAHASTLYKGSNCVAENWIDEQAIIVTHSPKLTQSEIDNCQVVAYGNCAGDMWISGGPADSYEDVLGNWHSVTTSVGSPGFSRSPSRQFIPDLTVASGLAETTVFNAGGEMVALLRASSGRSVDLSELRPGVYVVLVRTDLKRTSQAVVCVP